MRRNRSTSGQDTENPDVRWIFKACCQLKKWDGHQCGRKISRSADEMWTAAGGAWAAASCREAAGASIVPAEAQGIRL